MFARRSYHTFIRRQISSGIAGDLVQWRPPIKPVLRAGHSWRAAQQLFVRCGKKLEKISISGPQTAACPLAPVSEPAVRDPPESSSLLVCAPPFATSSANPPTLCAGGHHLYLDTAPRLFSSFSTPNLPSPGRHLPLQCILPLRLRLQWPSSPPPACHCAPPVQTIRRHRARFRL